MSERYSRLFLLSENLYTEGAPVIIAAGTLLKDNQTGGILAQLKLQNISTKDIKAVKAEISPLDTVGNPLGEPVEKQYLDLSVARNMTFGQKAPIVLPDNSTRAYAARVTEVAFQDNTVWKDTGGEWKSLLTQQTLTEALKDPELVRQYQLTYGSHCQFAPAEDRDLWLCVCGQVNHAAEERCSVCECSCAALQNVDFEALEKAKQARLAEEAQKAAEAKAKAEAARAIAAAKAKVVRKKLAITAAVVVPVIIALIIVNATVIAPKFIVPKKKYNEAMGLIESEKYSEAYAILEEIGKEDEIAQNKYERAMRLIEAKEYEEAYLILEEIGKEDEIAQNKYERAMRLIEAKEYEEAYLILEEIGKIDEIKQNRIDRAMALVKAGSFEEASSLLESLENKDEILYNRAVEAIDSGEYIIAYQLLNRLDYKDSEKKKDKIKPQYKKMLMKEAKVGSTVLFGSYEQNNNTNNGKEDIEWQVLEIDGDKALVISKYGLDAQPYNTESVKVTWETCSLRTWLNNTFYKNAFTTDEQSKIQTTVLENDDNKFYSNSNHVAEGGNDTKDKVFLLSLSEAGMYFGMGGAGEFELTAYAIAQGAQTDRVQTTNSSIATGWAWLRSPGAFSNQAAVAYNDGFINNYGEYVGETMIGAIRPAMWISLDY